MTNAPPSGRTLPIAKSLAALAAPRDEEDEWDIDEPTAPNAFFAPNIDIAPSEPDLTSAVADQEAAVTKSAAPSDATRTLEGESLYGVSESHEAAQVELGPASAPPSASTVSVTVDAPQAPQAPANEADEADGADDDAELMALIAAAKARADDVPPPPPQRVPTSAPSPASTVSVTVDAPQAQADEAVDDAKLMALIAAAKARADDVPPPPPQRVSTSAPPPASNASASSDGQSTADELDEDAQLMALIAAAKARADDVPPPPPR